MREIHFKEMTIYIRTDEHTNLRKCSRCKCKILVHNFSKIEINGPNTDPIYSYLKKNKEEYEELFIV